MKLILSLTTYPKRFDYLQTSIKSILNQTIYDKADLFYINIDDNLTEEDYKKYDGLKALDPKIRIKVCPAKWKSCNKLIWVYKDHPDDIIVCFDDDKNYPSETLEQVYETWKEHPECIVAQEINPIVRTPIGDINYINSIDAMLNQIEYGKYLSNGCLFPPNSFTDMLFDYDEMMHITNGNHDELWFWLVSTLKGVPCIGLDYTYSHSIDDGVCLSPTESDLTNINNKQATIDGYNQRINAKYKKQLNDVLMSNPVKFFISHDTILKFTGNIKLINMLYGNFPIEIVCDSTIVKSWHIYLCKCLSMFNWFKTKVVI